MGHELKSRFQLDARKLILLIGIMFVVIIKLQYLEVLYRNVLSTPFPSGKVSVEEQNSFLAGALPSAESEVTTHNVTHSIGLNYKGTYAGNEKAQDNEIYEERDTDLNNDAISETNVGLKISSAFGEGSPNESSTKELVELNKNSAVDFATSSKNKSTAEGAGAVNEKANNVETYEGNEKDQSIDFISEEVGLKSSILDNHRESSSEEFEDYLEGYNNNTVSEKASKAEERDTNSPMKNTLEKDAEASFRNPVVHVNSGISSVEQHVTPRFDKKGKFQEVKNNSTSLGDEYNSPKTPKMKRKPEMPSALATIADMKNLFYQSRVSYHSTTPRWPSAADKVLLNARSQIENIPILENDQQLYAPLYRNVSMFKRSYELMESTLKVYVYKEGKRPIFHTPVLKGIYASEGWFMKQLVTNKKFVTKKPREALLFYLPFSSRMLEETLYVPDSHNEDNLIEYLKKYVDMIAEKYPFWNRTEGADHFLVACHDWAASETKEYMANSIRALCNSDLREGYIFGKDASLPETIIWNPQKPLRSLGGKPPSKRSILAFFAGGMHGYLRPILLQHWGNNKDPDMKIFGQMPNRKGKMNYVQYIKSSKYCICPRGYEVNSPRVVEAIFHECVPVIISDNFVPPFFEVLNWESFAVFVSEKDVPNLKKILLSISEEGYLQMQLSVKKVQQHFLWHPRPEKYDIFHMILHSVWYNRVFQMKA
ncbi:Exostosin family protein, putative isoform 2 [Hibiscus syriacus]|uniref:Exostosin family protein, putative isoform 2 n=1 Tax=Hibiscus syriacus TaxID=106335 RepID=A0A6A2ZAM9_HIBSY|nr:probable glycosyltransferase At3g07620 [Hibiscus syriacus]XP_039017144.1 probable glycosyltransferase At3g07620 [Hibiscus syriacus]XP_039017145.1 probable glycosyltransferase At3g07620 [Hibiscus syriacus]KAE8688988.1 Exostosin family protein, putative isoform 2 [Hibiscus syriacus]